MSRRALLAAFLLAALLVACGPEPDVASPFAWTDDLAALRVPDRPVEGRIAGHRFRPDLVQLVNGTLVFRQREYVEPYLVLAIRSLPPAPLRLECGPGGGGPTVETTWKTEDDLFAQMPATGDGYVLRLELLAPAEGSVAGRIAVCLPDEARSHLAGTFVAELPQPPAPEEGPAVFGRIDHSVRDERRAVSAGYLGETTEGKPIANEVRLMAMGWPFPADWTATTFAPRLTTIAHDPWAGYTFRHVGLEAGWYLIYAREHPRLLAWRWVRVEGAGSIEVDLGLRPEDAGGLEVTVVPAFDDVERQSEVVLVPLDESGELPPLRFAPGEAVAKFLADRLPLRVVVRDGRASLEGLGPGRYRILAGERARGSWEVRYTASVNVPAGETIRVRLDED